MNSSTELPVGDELAAILGEYDDDHLEAYIAGLLHYYDLPLSNLDPFQPESLSGFADVMLQDVIVAARAGNTAPLLHYAYRGVTDVAKVAWHAHHEGKPPSVSGSAEIGAAIRTAIRPPIDAEPQGSGGLDAESASRGRVYRALRRLRGSGRALPPTPGG